LQPPAQIGKAGDCSIRSLRQNTEPELMTDSVR
jgi:hypothetical protein